MTPSLDRAEARVCFKEASQLNADDPRVWQALAKLADTPTESVEALRQLLRVAPETPNASVALRNALAADARALADANRADDAYKRWREAVDLTGGDVEVWLGVANTTTNQEEANRAIETAYKLNPSNEQAIAAMRRLQASKIDPAKVVAPVDAFARFGAEEEAAPAAGLAALDGDAVFAKLDESLDAFASFSDVQPQIADAPSSAQNAGVPVRDVEAILSAQKPEPAWDELEVEPSPVAAAPIAAAAIARAPIAVAQPAPVAVESPAPAAVAAPPASAVIPAPAAPVASAPAPAVSSNGSTRKTVMIVDDSPTIRKILGLTLERAGYKVVAEPDGESAIERLIQVVPDLILLDIAMPKIDGYEVCKRIKQDPRTKHVPVVMLSGKGALFDKVKGHMAGATEYLTKPFETPAVLAVVTNYCEQAAAEVVNG